jgi:hypothetical protein
MRPGMRPIALCLLAVWFSSCGAGEPKDVKVYAVVTVDATPMLMFTAVYRASVRDQKVLWWVEGVPADPMALENCTVRDASNWRCEERGPGAAESGKVMVDGRYGTFGAAVPEGWKYLTEPEWKALQTRQK